MTNNKDIIIGNNGIGILGLNKLTPTSQADGYKITQAANSTIKYSGNAKSAFGVVGDGSFCCPTISSIPRYCTVSTFHCPSVCFKNGI